MQLTERSTELSFGRRMLGFAACGLLAVGTCGSAWAFRTGALEPAGQSAAPAAAGTTVPSGVMAGNVVARVNPTYPAEARSAHIQGSVVLHAVISKAGLVESVSVLSGPPELQASAVEAVRQWTYKPYVQNGQPVDVETTITVNYQLNE